MSSEFKGRIQIHGQGIGEMSVEDIERRAGEIARMDGRREVNEPDRIRARDELIHPGSPPAPEADETDQPIPQWGDGMASEGHRAPRTGIDDEVSVVEQLVEEGVEEAERDRRLAASEDLPEE